MLERKSGVVEAAAQVKGAEGVLNQGLAQVLGQQGIKLLLACPRQATERDGEEGKGLDPVLARTF